MLPREVAASGATVSQAAASQATASRATASLATASQATASLAAASQATVSLASASLATASQVTASGARTSQAPTEYELKAALLYNFARFATWPSESFGPDRDSFVIAIVGNDPFGSGLDDAIRGRTVEGRSITIERWESAEDVGSCHVLFVSVSDREGVRRILHTLRGRSVLTVSDTKEFAREGGSIGLDLADGRVRMTINTATVRGSGIRISSKLLALATLVEDAP